MPVVTIHAFPTSDEAAIIQMIAEIRESGARALKCPISNIWVACQAVSQGSYVQADNPKNNPPLVIIRAQEGRSAEERTAFVQGTVDAVGRALSIPSSRVWVHYQEMRPQDVWFEGHWSGQ